MRSQACEALSVLGAAGTVSLKARDVYEAFSSGVTMQVVRDSFTKQNAFIAVGALVASTLSFTGALRYIICEVQKPLVALY